MIKCFAITAEDTGSNLDWRRKKLFYFNCHNCFLLSAYLPARLFVSVCVFCLPFCLSFYLPACYLSICLSGFLSACLPVYLCICLSVCLYVCLSVCLYVCLSVYLSICLSFCLSVFLSFCLSVCLSVFQCVCLFVRLSVCFSVCLSVCISICRSNGNNVKLANFRLFATIGNWNRNWLAIGSLFDTINNRYWTTAVSPNMPIHSMFVGNLLRLTILYVGSILLKRKCVKIKASKSK
jgi:hypothetical protein